MKEERIIEMCRDHNIFIGKPPASTTSISQPLDVGNVFLGAKSVNKGIRTAGQRDSFMEVSVTEKINAMIKKHELNIGKPFQSSHKGFLNTGLQQVRHIIAKSIKRSTITESFNRTGQYMREKGGCDVEKILSTCTTKFNLEEVTKVWEFLPLLKKKMLQQGELFESDYKCLGMTPHADNGGASRDNLVLNRRRFVFLTNPALLQREEEKRNLKIANVETAAAAKKLKRKADALEKLNNPQPKQPRKKNHPNLVLKIRIPARN